MQVKNIKECRRCSPAIIRKYIVMCITVVFAVLQSPVFAAAEYTKPVFRKTWRKIRVYQKFKQFDPLPAVIVNDETYPGILHNLLEMKTEVIAFDCNEDATKFALILRDAGFPKVFYLEPESITLQEFSLAVGFRDETPKMTLDGKTVFFVSDRFGNREIYSATYEDFVKKPDYLVNLLIDNLSDNYNISIDNTGAVLAYQSAKEGGNYLIYIKNLADGSEQVPSYVKEKSIRPVLSGNGKFILYTIAEHQNNKIMLGDIENKTVSQITAESPAGSSAVISADGSKVIYIAEETTGISDVFMFDRNQKAYFNVSANPKSRDYDPHISDDGMVIAFQAEGEWDSKAVFVVDMRNSKIWRFWKNKTDYVKPRLSRNGNILILETGGVLKRIDLEEVRKKGQGETPKPQGN